MQAISRLGLVRPCGRCLQLSTIFMGKCSRLQSSLPLLPCDGWHNFKNHSNPPFRCLSTSLDCMKCSRSLAEPYMDRLCKRVPTRGRTQLVWNYTVFHWNYISCTWYDSRQTISLYGHKSTTKYHSLESHHSNGTIEQFANNVALVCGKNPAHRQIEVCFVYKAEVIVSLIIF